MLAKAAFNLTPRAPSLQTLSKQPDSLYFSRDEQFQISYCQSLVTMGKHACSNVCPLVLRIRWDSEITSLAGRNHARERHGKTERTDPAMTHVLTVGQCVRASAEEGTRYERYGRVRRVSDGRSWPYLGLLETSLQILIPTNLSQLAAPHGGFSEPKPLFMTRDLS